MARDPRKAVRRNIAGLRAQKNPSKLAPQMPRCRIHGTTMEYNPETVRWECPEDECKSVAYPPHDEGRPVLGKGPITFVRRRDDKGEVHHYLMAKNNVMLLIDDLIVSEGPVDPNGSRMLAIRTESELNIDMMGNPV